MRTVRFGRTGEAVSAVSFGTWPHSGPALAGKIPVGWSGHDDELARQALVRAHAAGIRHWDTADVYGDGQAERLIGSVWGEVPRRDIFLATKVGWDPGSHGSGYHPAQMKRQMDRSLTNLKVDHVDLYYLHHCNFGDRDEYFADAVGTARRFREEGKTRFLGLSDWDCHRVLRFIARADPDVVQPYRNVLADAYEASGLRAWVEEHDLGVAFFSPLRHGLLLGKYDEPPSFGEGDMRGRIPEFKDPAFLARMRAARAALEARFDGHPQPVLHGLTGALLADAATGCVLLGLRSPAQVAAAAQLGAALAPEEAAWVRELYQEG